MLKRIRGFLFSVGLYKKCPECTGELMYHGFKESGQRITCKECDFQGETLEEL